jgi:hypothetical protein
MLLKCCKCGKTVEDDNVNGLKYKKKSYCVDCFCNEFDQDEVDKHFAYLTFQRIFDRVPSSAEWTQMTRLIKEYDWDWYKIEMMLIYVYEIELKEVTEEYGAIGILPYYEAQARKFFKERDNAMSEDYEEPKVIKIFGIQIKKQPKKVEFTSIDNLIDWDDDAEWQE